MGFAMKSPLVVIVIVSSLLLHHQANQASAQYNQQRGTVLGGLTGAAAGAIIGENSDEPGAGAAIGGVVGAIAGSVLGNAEDQRSRAYYAQRQQQIYAQQQYRQTQSVGLDDVIAMSRSGVSDQVIITAIQQRGLPQQLAVNDIVYLSQNGVSDNVIHSMQQLTSGCGGAPVVVARPNPVVIQSRPTVRLQYGYGSPYYYRAYGHPRGRGYYR